MKEFEILLDSTSDLDKSFQDEFGIICIPGHLTIDGVESESFVEWTTTTREEFYSALKANPERCKTSPPSIGELSVKMEEIALSGKGVLYITISSGLSGTYNIGLQAKKIVEGKIAYAEIECVDSMRFGPAIGLMAVNASIMRSEGKSLSEVAAALNENKNRYHQAGWLDDLSYVAKQGRLTHSKAFFGTLVGIKPIGEFDYNGLTTVLGKVKGENAAYEVLLKYIRETARDIENQIVFIAQTNRPRQAEKFKELIEKEFHPKRVEIKDVYPSCGANIGPGLMAAYYTGTEISADLSVEKDIIKRAIGG